MLLVAKHDGTVIKRVSLRNRDKLTIGRSQRCELVLTSSSVSRRHALLFSHAGQWHLVDTGSRFGLHSAEGLMRHLILIAGRWARIGPAYLWLGQEEPGSLATPTAPLAKPGDTEPPSVSGSFARLVVADAAGSTLQRWDLSDRDLVTIGSSAQCDVILSDPHVSPLHCVLYTEHRGWYVTDAASAGGTFVLGGPTRRRRLALERLVRVGTSLLWLDRDRDWHPADVQDYDPSAQTVVATSPELAPQPPATAQSAFLSDAGDLL